MYTKLLITLLFISKLMALSINIAQAKVVTTLPEFTWVTKQLLPKVESISLLEGVEDPHFIDASPSFVFKLAKAKLLILNGLELETGWLPAVIQMSGNADIQPGSNGYCNASTRVGAIGKLKKFDRSLGDVHAMGNPHYTLSILKMISSAQSIKDCLIKTGYDEKIVDKNFKVLKRKLNDTHARIIKMWQKPKTFYVYHREFNYLTKEFPLKLRQSLEAVPGILPSANHLLKISKLAKKEKPVKVLASSTAPEKVLKKFKEISNIPYLKLQLHPSRNQDYIEFITNFHKKILQ